MSRERQSQFSFSHRSSKRKCVSPARIHCSCDFVGSKHNDECLSSSSATAETAAAAKEAETNPKISTKWIAIKQLRAELKNDLRAYYIGLVNKYFPDQLFYIKNIDEIAWVADDLHARQIIEFVKTALNIFNVLLPVYFLQKE